MVIKIAQTEAPHAKHTYPTRACKHKRIEQKKSEQHAATPKNDDMHMRWWGAGGCAPNFYMGALGHAANSVQLNLGHQAMQRRRMYTGWP